jgi:hypothetical protein
VGNLVDTELAVRDLHARYTDAVWRKDFTAFGECFTHGAEWHIGGLALQGRARIVEGIEKILANFRRVLITLHTPIVHINAGGISARSFVTEQVARLNGQSNVSVGRYYERFELEDRRLRFSWRLFELHYSGPPDLTGSFSEHPDYGPPPAMPPQDAPSGDFAAAKWGIGADTGKIEQV